MIRLTALALAGSAILGLSGLATPAAAACDPPQDVRIHGAEAHWTECHNGRRTQVDGWVKDNKADGKCAEVYSMFSNGTTQRAIERARRVRSSTFTLMRQPVTRRPICA